MCVYTVVYVYDTKTDFKCATPKCTGVGVVKKEQTSFKCSICKKTTCIACKVEHAPNTCEQYEKWKTMNDAAEELTLNMMAADGSYMECPGCGWWSTLESGCEHVDCLNQDCRVSWSFDTGELT